MRSLHSKVLSLVHPGITEWIIGRFDTLLLSIYNSTGAAKIYLYFESKYYKFHPPFADSGWITSIIKSAGLDI